MRSSQSAQMGNIFGPLWTVIEATRAALRYPQTCRSSSAAAFLTGQDPDPLSNPKEYVKSLGEERVSTISTGTAQAPFATALPEGCAHHTRANLMAGVVQEAHRIHFQARWVTTSSACTAPNVP